MKTIIVEDLGPYSHDPGWYWDSRTGSWAHKKTSVRQPTQSTQDPKVVMEQFKDQQTGEIQIRFVKKTP